MSQETSPALSKAPKVSVVVPCFNEQENVEDLARQVSEVLARGWGPAYEIIFIDNDSTDGTAQLIKRMATQDRRIKLIVNQRNFGHIRSPYHGILQASGDCVVCMAADFQDPPEMIGEFLAHWKAGSKVVMAVKVNSRESRLMWVVRRAYYRVARAMADVELLENATGFGLFDRAPIERMRSLEDPYPYFRGIIAELGFEVTRVPYTQPRRGRGVSKNNFYSLYDLAMLGITSHSKVPIRLATMFGFALSAVSLLVSLVYLVLKLVYWDRFLLGTAPLLIAVFFFASVQLFFIGLLGEYVAAIHTRVMNRPHVVEKERVNFDIA